MTLKQKQPIAYSGSSILLYFLTTRTLVCQCPLKSNKLCRCPNIYGWTYDPILAVWIETEVTR